MFAGKNCFLLVRILFWLLRILGLLFNILLLLVKIFVYLFCWFYIFQFWFVKIQFPLINPPDLPIVGAQILHWFHARITHQTWEAVAETQPIRIQSPEPSELREIVLDAGIFFLRTWDTSSVEPTFR